MLKYFKRQKSHRKGKADAEGRDECNAVDGAKRHSLRSTSSFCDEIFLDELSSGDGNGYMSLSGAGFDLDADILKYNSRLSLSLPSIVSNPNCLSFFVQYLETKNALPLIKFYLDTENFKAAAVTQLNAKSKETKGTAAASSESHNVALEKEKVENNCVPELKTLCDLSMRQPLTDDEKSQIYAETNKKITKCNNDNSINNNNFSNTNNNNNNNDNNHKLKASVKLSKSHCGNELVATEIENVSHTISAASVQDAIAIYQKYLIANANHFVRLPVAIISQISLLLCKRNDDGVIESQSEQPISAECFGEAQNFVLQQMESEYLHDFLQSTFYCKYCIELIERASAHREEKLSIYDILHSEVALFFFMEFLEQRGERNCLDFWTTAINFRKSFNSESMSAKDESDAQADAMIIYEKFFSLQADFRLWMSDKLRCRVEERICSDECGLIANCFDLPLQVTAKYLEQKHFDDFLKSQLFENYLNELKTKVHEELAFGTLSKSADIDASRNKQSARRKTRHRKTLSDCTNESTHNTLLAMDTSQQHLLRNQLNTATTATNMNIDARHLTNPSLLWQRTWATNAAIDGGGLKFGRVNSLGRYERDFDTIDGSRHHNWSLTESGNKIKNAMRKLVNLPEEKVQEEIAWQVAEMIVKDVTSVTLKNKGASTA